MPFLMSFALEPEMVTLAWIDNDSVQFPLNIYATKGFIRVNSRNSRLLIRVHSCRFVVQILSAGNTPY